MTVRGWGNQRPKPVKLETQRANSDRNHFVVLMNAKSSSLSVGNSKIVPFLLSFGWSKIKNTSRIKTADAFI
jgi:hypothetical protein